VHKVWRRTRRPVCFAQLKPLVATHGCTSAWLFMAAQAPGCLWLHKRLAVYGCTSAWLCRAPQATHGCTINSRMYMHAEHGERSVGPHIQDPSAAGPACNGPGNHSFAAPGSSPGRQVTTIRYNPLQSGLTVRRQVFRQVVELLLSVTISCFLVLLSEGSL